MTDDDGRLGYKLTEFLRSVFDGFNLVMQKVNLTTALEFT